VPEGARIADKIELRPDRHENVVAPGQMSPHAPSRPVFGPRDKPRTNGIEADMAQARDRMRSVHHHRREVAHGTDDRSSGPGH